MCKSGRVLRSGMSIKLIEHVPLESPLIHIEKRQNFTSKIRVHLGSYIFAFKNDFIQINFPKKIIKINWLLNNAPVYQNHF